MGIMVSGRCGCGFKTAIMYLGGGRLNFQTVNNMPCYCKDCKTLFESNLYDENAKCANCKSRNFIPYTDENLNSGNDFYMGLKREKNFCPVCQTYSLHFNFIGNWD